MYTKTHYVMNIPIYGAHTQLIIFPTPNINGEVIVWLIKYLDLKICFSQNLSNFTLLTNDVTPIHNSGSVVPVPYLPGHDYALLPGADNGFLDIKYSATVPDCTQNFTLVLNNFYISALVDLYWLLNSFWAFQNGVFFRRTSTRDYS